MSVYTISLIVFFLSTAALTGSVAPEVARILIVISAIVCAVCLITGAH